MTALRSAVTKAFPGNKGILRGKPNVLEYSATPNLVITAPIGTLCYDYTNDDVYINTDGATAWIVINA